MHSSRFGTRLGRLALGAMALWLSPLFAQAPRWDFVARLDPGAERLFLRGCSQRDSGALWISTGADGTAFLISARHRDRPLTAIEGAIRIDDWHAGDCYQTVIDLKAAAESDRWGLGRQADRYWRLPPALWFWRPKWIAADSSIRFELPPGWSASVPWAPIDAAQGLYRIGATPRDWPAQVAFGRFTEQTLSMGGGRLRVAILPSVDAALQVPIRQWFAATAQALTANDGRMPVADLQVLIVPLPGVSEPVPWGQVSRGGGAAVSLFVGAGAGRERLEEDWTATHELAHLQHPYLGERGRWLAEGLASYYQNVWRARRGNFSASEAWRRLDAGFARGRAVAVGPPLRDLDMSRGATMRLYWSGAAFWLEADLALRQHGSSLDQLLAAFRDRYLPSERYWPPADFIGALQQLAPQAGLLGLYQGYGELREFPDLAAAYRQLGLKVAAVPDGELPPQPLRDAIMGAK